MSLSIRTNPPLYTALQNFRSIEDRLSIAQNRVSTGLKVGGAIDDASNFAVAQGIRSEIASWNSVKQGMGSAAGVVKVAIAGATKISELLNDMRARIVEGTNPGVTEQQRALIQADIDKYSQLIDEFVNNSEFNGINLLKGVEPTNTAPTGTVNSVDLIFAVDVTGSMGSSINKVKQNINTVLENFQNQGIPYRLGLVRYAGGAEQVSFSGSAYTTDINEFISAIDLSANPPTLSSANSGAGGAQGTFGLNFADGAYANDPNVSRNFVLVTDTDPTEGRPTPDPLGIPTATATNNVLDASGTELFVIGKTNNNNAATEYNELVNGTQANIINIDSPSYDVAFDGISEIIAQSVDGQNVPGDTLDILVNPQGDQYTVGHRPMSVAALSLNGLNITSNPQGALSAIESAIEDVSLKLGKLGANARQIDAYMTNANDIEDAVTKGLGNIVDADMAKESARLTAAQVQRELASQVLGVTGQSSQILLQLFQR